MAKIAIIENSDGLGQYFTKCFDKSEYEIFPVWDSQSLPEDILDAYIFTGDYNNISDGLLPLHEKEIEFVKTIKNKKIFASCFFHQLYGLIYGGKVEKREKRFLGWQKTEINKNHPILDGIQEPYFLNLNVDELISLPDKAEIIGTNPDCKYQMLNYNDNVFTCQSHPEIYKQEALEAIKIHEESLIVRCHNLDEIVEKTKDIADDDVNARFMENLTKWLKT